jgi:hypothetical protein
MSKPLLIYSLNMLGFNTFRNHNSNRVIDVRYNDIEHLSVVLLFGFLFERFQLN